MQYAILSEVPEYQRKSHSFLQLHSHDYLQSYFKIEHSCLLQLFTFLIATICMKNQINFLYLIWIIHHCLGTVFELPSHGTQSHFQFLFKIEPLQGFHLSRGSSNMNIIKIGDIKIFAGTPGPASTLHGLGPYPTKQRENQTITQYMATGQLAFADLSLAQLSPSQ